MALLKLIDVSRVQAGDTLVINNIRYTCEYVDNDGIAYDLQLHDWKGNKIHKCLTLDEKVSIEI